MLVLRLLLPAELVHEQHRLASPRLQGPGRTEAAAACAHGMNTRASSPCAPAVQRKQPPTDRAGVGVGLEACKERS